MGKGERCPQGHTELLQLQPWEGAAVGSLPSEASPPTTPFTAAMPSPLIKAAFVSGNVQSDQLLTICGWRDPARQPEPRVCRPALPCPIPGPVAPDARGTSRPPLLDWFVETCRILCVNSQGMKRLQGPKNCRALTPTD